jgi:hypothetical protein
LDDQWNLEVEFYGRKDLEEGLTVSR